MAVVLVVRSLGAIGSSAAISDVDAGVKAAGEEHVAQVITHISYLMQKMGRAGLQPDGITYTVLHGMWLRIGNLPQAVGALAQAKQRAAQRYSGSRGLGSYITVTGSDCDTTSPSSKSGEPLWDPVLRDEEISRHLRSMVTAHGNEDENQRQRAANLDQLCVPSHTDLVQVWLPPRHNCECNDANTLA